MIPVVVVDGTGGLVMGPGYAGIIPYILVVL